MHEPKDFVVVVAAGVLCVGLIGLAIAIVQWITKFLY